MDWTTLGIADLVIAVLAAAATSALLSWRFPMAPLSPALIAGGMAAGLVLLLGRMMPGAVVLVGGGAAALVGLAYDRATLPRWGLFLIEIVIAMVTLALAVPLAGLGAALGVELSAPFLVVGLAIVIALISGALRRSDRLPGLAPALGAAFAAVATLLAVLNDVPEAQSIWWLASIALICAGLSIIGRARATPFGAAGTSYLALTLCTLALTVFAAAGNPAALA